MPRVVQVQGRGQQQGIQIPCCTTGRKLDIWGYHKTRALGFWSLNLAPEKCNQSEQGSQTQGCVVGDQSGREGRLDRQSELLPSNEDAQHRSATAGQSAQSGHCSFCQTVRTWVWPSSCGRSRNTRLTHAPNRKLVESDGDGIGLKEGHCIGIIMKNVCLLK